VDACTTFFWLFVLLAFVALVGHGIWVLCAAIVNALSTGGAARPLVESRRAERIQCLRCGTRFRSERQWCPACHLDSQSVEAVQVQQLDVTADQIARLVRHELLTPESAQPVQESVEKLRTALRDHLGVPRRQQQQQQVPPLDVPAMLAACADVRLLPVADCSAPSPGTARKATRLWRNKRRRCC
jgi:hypothetical protein